MPLHNHALVEVFHIFIQTYTSVNWTEDTPSLAFISSEYLNPNATEILIRIICMQGQYVYHCAMLTRIKPFKWFISKIRVHLYYEQYSGKN